MILRCLIVDDERLARVELAALLEEVGGCSVLAEAGNADQGVELIGIHQPDVVFLDINMPGANGFDLLTRLDDCPLVVFVTAYDQFAIRAFEVNALDYLLKPVRLDRLEKTVALIRERLPTEQRNRIFITTKDGGKFVNLKDIFLVRAYDHYVRVYHSAGSNMLHQSLKEFMKRLAGQNFFMANRSEAIRLDTVAKVGSLSRGRYMLSLPAGESVVVSERQSVVWRREFSG
ncbi:MAG: LytR/AlgR family response regulator transcription factor [Saprospiraceae bacterium]